MPKKKNQLLFFVAKIAQPNKYEFTLTTDISIQAIGGNTTTVTKHIALEDKQHEINLENKI